MFYAVRLLQACGLTIILIDFLRNFPDLMSRLVLCVGIGMFTLGWLINKFVLKQ